MDTNTQPSDLIENLSYIIQTEGVWLELNKSAVLEAIESLHKPEIIYHYQIVDIVVHNDKVLAKWRLKQNKNDKEEAIRNSPENYIDGKDLPIWPHTKSYNWFMERLINKYMNVETEELISRINKGQLVLCASLSAPEIVTFYITMGETSQDRRTLFMLLNVLSAAYDFPLLPGLPTDSGKRVASNILQGD